MLAFLAIAISLGTPQMAVCAYDPEMRQISNTGNPTPQYEATVKPWFKAKDALTVAGARYAPSGPPKAHYNTYFYLLAMKDGVPIFVRDLDEAAPGLVYLLVDSDRCGFQAYARIPG